MQTERPPGKLLRRTTVFGLTTSELVALAFIPSVFLLLGYLTPIPSIATVILGALFVVVELMFVVRAPDGQKPLTWLEAKFKRSLHGDTTYIQPRVAPRVDIRTLNKFQSEDVINDKELFEQSDMPALTESVTDTHGDLDPEEHFERPRTEDAAHGFHDVTIVEDGVQDEDETQEHQPVEEAEDE